MISPTASNPLRLRDERHLAEEALLAYAQQWRTTFDAISDPVFVVDPAGSITQCNKALTYFIGIPYDKIIGTRACESLSQHLALPGSLPALPCAGDTALGKRYLPHRGPVL